MTADEFDAILERRIGLIRSVLAIKAKEYATDDRLHNFKRAGQILGCSDAQALLGMMAKHWVSVLDIVEQYSDPEQPLRINHTDAIDEKIGDSINYLILLEAVLKE